MLGNFIAISSHNLVGG